MQVLEIHDPRDHSAPLPTPPRVVSSGTTGGFASFTARRKAKASMKRSMTLINPWISVTRHCYLHQKIWRASSGYPQNFPLLARCRSQLQASMYHHIFPDIFPEFFPDFSLSFVSIFSHHFFLCFIFIRRGTSQHFFKISRDRPRSSAEIRCCDPKIPLSFDSGSARPS